MNDPRLPTVAVLISTYDGEAFLAAQLDSLAGQQGVAVQVFARDDGSRDGTLRVLAAYADRWPQLAHPLVGDNLRPARSFMTLLGSVPDDFDYYAFCDQDDVWLPDKLARAVGQLQTDPPSAPALYCSNVLCVDQALNALGPPRRNGDPRFEHLLFENIAFGNTVVMNRAARRTIVSHPPQRGMIMHDWWCTLVISATGRVIYDETARILYRQHDRNSIGATRSRLVEIARRVRTFFRNPSGFWPTHSQATEFLRLYGDQLDPARRRLVEGFVRSRKSLVGRIGFAAFGGMVRSNRLDAVMGRLLVLAGWY
jgi:glycosyltransferase involved in cell wall biosynthesis